MPLLVRILMVLTRPMVKKKNCIKGFIPAYRIKVPGGISPG
jgi:hypothetical protein